MIPESVRIVEVGPRDGLQNEPKALGVSDRVAFIRDLAQCGLRHIEAGSFVREDRVPQMAETNRVLAQLDRDAGIGYPVLVPNMRGLENALDAGAREIAVFAAASETFSLRNINCSIAQSLERFSAVAEKASSHGIRVRGYISCVLGCPYESAVPPGSVLEVAKRLSDMGCYEISLGDTIGTGTPNATLTLIETVASEIPLDNLAVHFHDTYGQALSNILIALQAGVSVIDSSVAGLGGCPYARGASGNVATEDVVYMLDGMGIRHGVDLDLLITAGRAVCALLDRPVMSRVSLARQSNSSEN